METMFKELEQKQSSTKSFQTSLVTSLIILGVVIWYRSRRKSKIPGPGLLNSLKLLNRNNAMRLRLLDEWARTYKDIYEFRLGSFSVVCLNSPQLIQKLLASRDSNYLSKPHNYDVFRRFIGDGILVSEGEKWKSRRKIINSHMFAYGTLTYYMKLFNTEADNLVNILDSLATSQFPAPIENTVLKSTLSVISRVLLGQSLNNRDGPMYKRVIWLMTEGKKVVLTKVMNPLLRLPPLWRVHPLYNVESESLKIVKDLKSSVMCSDFPFKAQLQASGVPPEEIFDESLNLLTAGFDTTAMGLHFLLLMLALHPSRQEKCQQEVDELFEESPNNISLAALSQLTYLEMCMNETLRLIPVIPGFLREIKSPLKLGNGRHLPANTTVLVHSQGIHMNPEYYPEPQLFIPERFSKEESRKRNPYAFLPYSGGPRGCIGYKYANMLMLVFAAKLLQQYHFSTTATLEDALSLPYTNLTSNQQINFIISKRSCIL